MANTDRKIMPIDKAVEWAHRKHGDGTAHWDDDMYEKPRPEDCGYCDDAIEAYRAGAALLNNDLVRAEYRRGLRDAAKVVDDLNAELSPGTTHSESCHEWHTLCMISRRLHRLLEKADE